MLTPEQIAMLVDELERCDGEVPKALLKRAVSALNEYERVARDTVMIPRMSLDAPS